MSRFAARQCRKDAIDYCARRFGAELDRYAVTPALAFIGEVDSEHMIERRVIRMIEIDVRGADPHPALAALGAANQRRLFDDVGVSPYSAAMLVADAARWRLKKSKTLRHPPIACSGR